MGDRYEMDLNCADCNASNEAYYAESSGFISFKCKRCGKLNLIEHGWHTTIVTEKELDDIMESFGFSK